jgi:hypothetical protein
MSECLPLCSAGLADKTDTIQAPRVLACFIYSSHMTSNEGLLVGEERSAHMARDKTGSRMSQLSFLAGFSLLALMS